MNKAIFLDRDGVLNRERGYTFELENFEILPDVVDTLKQFKKNGYHLIIVSNQSGIAKKMYTKEHVEKLHKHLLDEFESNGINISEVYYCAHHPQTTKCICRKPNSLFLEKAIARFNLNPTLSYFIGDKETDVLAAEKAGVKGVQIEANTSLKPLLNIIA